MWLDPLLGNHVPLTAYFAAIIFVAWYAGVGPSLMTIILSVLLGDYFFAASRGSLAISGREHQVAVGIFVVAGLFIVLFSELRRREIVRRKRAEQTVRQTAQELRRSNADLEQFACIASHDLQEPLRAVTGFVTLLRDRYRGKLDDEADKLVDLALDGANRMSQFIQDLLAYSRVETHGKQPEPTPCERSLETAFANLQTNIANRNAKITHDPLPVVMADGAQLTQLFQNLIGNAVRFCRDNVPPEIHVGANRHGDQWVLSVKDNGIGIPRDQYDRVFEVFERLHGQKKYPGTGIGLVICRKIVERHGGRIWVESVVGEGTTFYFTLPDTGGSAARATAIAS
jgi:light-regulated signal transduction histidine kinase (bacteriophytochrome)